MTTFRSAKGFTLVELLVVAGLLATVFALIVGGIGRPNVASSVRRTAQDFGSRLLATQSRALGRREGAALILVPSSDDPRLGTIVLDAVAQPWITTGVNGGLPPAQPRSTSGTVSLLANPPVPDTGYKIRFQGAGGDQETSPGPSPWFAYTFTSATTGMIRFRTSAGQSLGNTIWPKTADQAKQAVIACYPTPYISGPAMAKQVAIDLKHSGMGEDPDGGSGYGRFQGMGSIAIAYESAGRVGEVMKKISENRSPSDQPIEPTGIIYFFVVPRADILESRNTLANTQSLWVAINPHTGRVTVAENITQSAETNAALSAARKNARAGASIK